MRPADPVEPVIEVEICHGFVVNHDGRVLTAADGAIKVPEAVAATWLRNGWAVEAGSPRRRRRRAPE
ncbi:hypothetical protein [Gordonia sp. SND2]|uniref:hypothetical protein n=1 Tax=Gordonia sp. SND2 TaxID=3388659 RepID=UPI00398A551F